jgi:hypothetical protein
MIHNCQAQKLPGTFWVGGGKENGPGGRPPGAVWLPEWRYGAAGGGVASAGRLDTGMGCLSNVTPW